MFRFAAIATGMWTLSLGLTYAHYRFCFPYFTLVEPCVSMQNGSVFLNKTLQSYGMMMIGMAVDTGLKYIPSFLKEKTSIEKKEE